MNEAKSPRKFVGNLVEKARSECEFSRNELGLLVGRTSMTVYNWEVGASFPNAEDLGKLAAALGKPVEYFFE